MTFVVEALRFAWQMLVDAAPFLWLGLIAAGVLHAWVPREWVMAQLGGRGPASVFKAALLGVPIPLCSCGVIPATVGLRRRGAGRGAALSFLISTPETSADSIALTYALLGPAWAVIRPVAAVIIATATGIAANLLPEREAPPGAPPDGRGQGEADATVPPGGKWRTGWDFVFRELIPDIGGWLLLGVLLSGFLLALLPADFLETLPGGAWSQMLMALLVGIPLYICAAASTPLAAALLLKGMAPGAALVLLLAGPATNLASAFVISRQLGKAGTVIYFAGVGIGSLVAGAMVEGLAPAWRLGEIQIHTEALPPWLNASLAVMLLVVIVIPRVNRWRRARTVQNSPLHNAS